MAASAEAELGIVLQVIIFVCGAELGFRVGPPMPKLVPCWDRASTYLVVEFMSPKKAYTFTFIGDYIIPKKFKVQPFSN